MCWKQVRLVLSDGCRVNTHFKSSARCKIIYSFVESLQEQDNPGFVIITGLGHVLKTKDIIGNVLLSDDTHTLFVYQFNDTYFRPPKLSAIITPFSLSKKS